MAALQVTPVVFTLYVKHKGKVSVNTLKYIEQNIKIIRDMGVSLNIIKISAEDLENPEKLHKRGVTGIPVLFTRKDKSYIGCKAIIELFESSKTMYKEALANFNKEAKEAENKYGPNIPFGNSDDPMLASFYQRELTPEAADRDRTSTEGDIGDALPRDYERRTQEYMKKRKSYKMPGGALVNEDEQKNDNDIDQKMSNHSKANMARHPRKPAELPDNITHQPPARQQDPPADAEAGDRSEMDDMFDRKYLDNLSADY